MKQLISIVLILAVIAIILFILGKRENPNPVVVHEGLPATSSVQEATDATPQTEQIKQQSPSSPSTASTNSNVMDNTTKSTPASQ